MHGYKKLIVWQKSLQLVNVIYELTKQLPHNEQYVLTSQMKRAAISISSNISEGYLRNHRKEYLQFLYLANGSAGELETQLSISKVQYPTIDYRHAESLLTEVRKLLAALIRSLKLPLNPRP